MGAQDGSPGWVPSWPYSPFGLPTEIIVYLVSLYECDRERYCTETLKSLSVVAGFEPHDLWVDSIAQ